MKAEPQRKAVVLTLGTTWAELFEACSARTLAGIIHLQLGDPHFRVSQETFKAMGYLQSEVSAVLKMETEELQRLNRNTTQASELVWKFEWLISHADVVFIETRLLDTAIGHHLLLAADKESKSVWAVGVDTLSSPLAPAFLRGVLYPSRAEELVKHVLTEIRF